MKVLVAVGSKYGSTREIAEVIAGELTQSGFDVDFLDAADVRSVEAYDGVVLGSAVYGGLWRRDAEDVIRDHSQTLAKRDTWTFSVGIETVVAQGQPRDEAPMLSASIGAREHRRFTGALNPDRLNMGERALLRALEPPLGDFRDFAAVRAWAQQISTELSELAAS